MKKAWGGFPATVPSTLCAAVNPSQASARADASATGIAAHS
jgi:hypothetical protein